MLHGKNIIVTGCARGVGNAMMHLFARHGARLWACVRKETEAFRAEVEAIRAECGAEITPLQFDLTDAEAIKGAVKQIMASKQRVDGLVNNAGVIHTALVAMTSADKVRQMMEANFIGPFILTQYVLKLMLRGGGGSIVNIASSAAFDGYTGKAAYGASKAAVVAATQTIAHEYGDKGIRANVLAPAIIDTDMIADLKETEREAIVDATSLGRAAVPQDVAEAAMWLLSDHSKYITGQTIRIDGGMHF